MSSNFGYGRFFFFLKKKMSKDIVPIKILVVHKRRKEVKIYSNYASKIQNEFTFGLWKKRILKKNEQRNCGPFTKFDGS